MFGKKKSKPLSGFSVESHKVGVNADIQNTAYLVTKAKRLKEALERDCSSEKRAARQRAYDEIIEVLSVRNDELKELLGDK